ncbi:recombinase family protein, partial [Kibdelosporangium philippinense]
DDLLCLREFLRVSNDRSGREASLDQQHEVLVADGQRDRFRLHPEPYREVGSASKYAKKARKDFDRLVKDLETGQFGAGGLALWELSRGSRKVKEWAHMIELLEEQGLLVWIHTHRRMYDPRIARDRRTLLEEAIDAEIESHKTSERLMRDVASRAAEGKAAGRLSWGYTRRHDEETGKLIGRVVIPEIAKLVNELFGRVVRGEAISGIEKLWARRGIVNGVGKPFTHAQLVEVLRNRTYIAERVHLPGKQGRWWYHRDEVRITKGDWPPILKGKKGRKLFFAAQTILDDPSRQKVRPGGSRHLQTMFTLCDECVGPMVVSGKRPSKAMKNVVRPGKGTAGGIRNEDGEGRAPIYRCKNKGCVTINKDDLEKFTIEVVLAYLSSPKVYEDLVRLDGEGGQELESLREKLDVLRQEHRDLIQSRKARRITLAAFESLEPDLVNEIETCEKEIRRLETPPVLRGLIEPGVDVRERWEQIDDPVRRRAIVQVVLTPERAGQLRVLKSPGPGKRWPVESRVVLHQAPAA